MGNDPSLPEEPSGYNSSPRPSGPSPRSHLGSQRLPAAQDGVPSLGHIDANGSRGGSELLPPMVLIVESVVWSSMKEPGHSQMFYAALLDGCEVGRAASYPSPSVRVAPCTMSSVVTLRFFAGIDGEGFLLRKGKAAEPRQVGEVRMPIDIIVQYGAPLYTSMWLGLPGDEATEAADGLYRMELKEALEYARHPSCPKVRVTFFKPAHEVLPPHLTPRSARSLPGESAGPPLPQPDIQALCIASRDDGSWDTCLGPSTPAHHCEVTKEQQVRGLVQALKHANDVGWFWQRAIFCPPDDVQLARRARDEAAGDREDAARRQRESRKAAILPPVAEDKDTSSVVSSGRQELERSLAVANKELERLRGVEEKQQALQQDLERARSDLKAWWSTETKHQEDLQQRLLTVNSENEALRAFRKDVGEDYDAMTRKLETATKENLALKQEKLANLSKQPLSGGSPSKLIVSTEEHEALKVKCKVLKDENVEARRGLAEALQREANSTTTGGEEEEALRGKLETLCIQVDALRVEKENILQREQQRQAQFNELASENKELMQREATHEQRDKEYLVLKEQLGEVEQAREGFLVRQTSQEASSAVEVQILQEKLAQADEDRRKLGERYELLAERLNELDLAEKTPLLAPRPEVSPDVVPMKEYEKVQMKYKEADQDREVLRARLEEITSRLRDLEAVTPPSTPKGFHERPISRAPPGVPVEDYQALQDMLVQTELQLQQANQDRQSYMEMAAQAQEAGASGAPQEDIESLQQKLAQLEEATRVHGAQFRSYAEENEALHSKLAQVEDERQGYMELARSKERWQSEEHQRELEGAQLQLESVTRGRDELQSQVVVSLSEVNHLRSAADGHLQEIDLLREELQRTSTSGYANSADFAFAVEAAVARSAENFNVREQALQSELSAALRAVDDIKQEKQALESRGLNSSRALNSSRDLSGSPPASATRLSRHASEEIMYKEGEKTILGARVSELRLVMKKKEAAHKEDVTKLNKELMTARALSNQDRQLRSDYEVKIKDLDQQVQGYEDRLRAQALKAEQLSAGDQDIQNDFARLSGEVEVLRIRERQWQAIATGNSDESSGSREAPYVSSMGSKSDSFVMRLFHRLLWEKFSHLEPDDLHKALKMDQRPATMPKSEVEKVLKGYRSHQKNFNMAKAFRALDVHRTGRLAPHEFELRLTQSLLLDVELSGHIYNLMHSVLHGDGSGASADARHHGDVPSASPKNSARETDSARSGSQKNRRMESSRSMYEGMINEEEFSGFFEAKTTAS